MGKRTRQPSTGKRGDEQGSPRAWIAKGCTDEAGYQVGLGVEPSLIIYAVSVLDSLSVKVFDRLRLIKDVVCGFAAQVPSGVPSIWVFPGGYFGYSAVSRQWQRLDRSTSKLEQDIVDLACRLPAPSLMAVGVDSLRGHDVDVTQQAWVVRRNSKGAYLSKVTRGESQLADRRFAVGSIEAAFFICGEFTGSKTESNGPFYVDRQGDEHFLTNPAKQLRGCHVLVDLAHFEVPGSVSGHSSPRMVHRRQMERFSKCGVAVLAHHHAGRLSKGHPHFRHQSNWIVFRGKTWLADSAVTELP